MRPASLSFRMLRPAAGTVSLKQAAGWEEAGLSRRAIRCAPWAFQEARQATSDGQQAFSVSDHPALARDNPLFQPYQLGPFHLKHRVVLAPLTRCRAIDTVPQPVMGTYYSQRASEGGLLLTEATCISGRAHGYPHTPGIYTDEHTEGWKPIVQAVHDKGALFFCQLWHVGRASHPDYQPNGELPVSSSAIPITDGNQVFSLNEGKMVDFPTPRALEAHEIPAVVQEYVRAARRAVGEAGFDGVEIHGANGYLIDQFLKDEINHRTDEYGGSIENRCRFALEVVKAVAGEIGSQRTGIRLSPFGGFQNATDSHPYALIAYLLEELNKLDLAYCHFVEPRIGANVEIETPDTLEPFRKVYRGTFMAAGGYKRETGMEAIANGHADLIAYGRYFVSNPDLPKRLLLNKPLNKYDRGTFYSQGNEGYIDYPSLEEAGFHRQQ